MSQEYVYVRRVTSTVIGILFFFVSLNCDNTDGGGRHFECVWPEVQPCEGHAVGICSAGYRSCLESRDGSFWGPCEGIIEPSEEVCDGLDNDCDSVVDNGVLNDCGTCGDVPQELCSGLDEDCDGEVDEGFGSNPELCDGLDNDCDGIVDEGLSKRRDCVPEGAGDWIVYNSEPNSRSTCTIGWKECREGAWSECFDFRGPEPEICDGWDNDCNGYVDEIDLQRNQCGLTDIGECAYGYEVCLNSEVVCWSASDPQNEICDGLDNDCDGSVDEDLQRECTTSCGRGVESCEDGFWADCSAPTPSPEVCDSEDNDCDGLIDEDLICLCDFGDAQPCPNVPCGWGLRICQEDGTWGDCEGNLPQPELCNNHDDDCDELVDEDLVMDCWEDDPELVGVGICVAGSSTCTEGVWGACEGQTLPQPERCDGIDNDCDGTVDNMERVFEKVDMVFAIDISGSMSVYIEALVAGITEYVLSLQGTEHRFAIVFYGGDMPPSTPEGDPYLRLQLSDISTFITTLDGLRTSGTQEPSFDVVHDLANPLNPLGLSWRSDATPIVVLVGDEGPQSRRGLLIDDLVDLTDVCGLPGCDSGTNPNWRDGDPLELFAFVLPSFMNVWRQACFGPGQRVFNIQRVLDEELLAIDLALLFQDICVDP